MNANDIFGFAFYGGIPVTLSVLFVNPPLAFVLGLLVFALFKYGKHLEAIEDSNRLAERVAEENRLREMRLEQEREEWGKEFDLIFARAEAGEITEPEAQALFDELDERWPE